MKHVLNIVFLIFILHVAYVYADPLQGTVDFSQASAITSQDTAMPHSVTSTTGAVAQTAGALSNPLSEVIVYLSFGSFFSVSNTMPVIVTFDSGVISQIPSSVIQNGLYVSVNTQPVSNVMFPTGGGSTRNGNAIEIKTILTDAAGNIQAEASYYAGARHSAGFYFYNVDTMTVNFKDAQGNQQQVKNVAMSQGKRVLFKGTGGEQGAGGGSSAPATYTVSNITTGWSSGTTMSYMNFNPQPTKSSEGFGNIVLAGSVGGVLAFNSALSTYLIGLSYQDWQNGVYIFVYGVDSNGKYLSDFSSVSSNNPGKLYVAVYDHTLTLKQHVEFSSNFTASDLTSWAVGINGVTRGLSQSYPQSLLLVSTSSKTKSPVPASTLFEGLGVTGAGSGGGAGVILGSGETLEYLALELNYGSKVATLPYITSSQTTYKAGVNGALSIGVTVQANLSISGSNRQATPKVMSGGTNLLSSMSPATFNIPITSGGTGTVTTSDTLTDAYVVYQTNNMDEAVKDKLSISSNAITQSYKFASSANISFTKISNAGPDPKNLNPGGGGRAINKSMSRFG